MTTQQSAGALRIDGTRFRDAAGRQVLLRGVNLGGDSKVPAAPDGRTHVPSDFADHRTVSFVGRPFPLAEADEHFRRLAHWGFNCLRLLTTWEAIEHAGPGVYDEAYLDYFAAICRRAGDYGFHVFIDFHQDVWSRMSGGDGAPGWTFEAVGLDFTKFDAAGAAHVMQHRYDHANPEPRQDAYPQMSWGGNHRLPANGVMWSLFWAGEALTPDFRIDGRNVQRFLQESYLGCLDQVARRVCGMPHVIGFDTLNEPALGWIGQALDYRHVAADAINPVAPRVGPALSPLDGLALLRGATLEVPRLVRNLSNGIAEIDGTVTLNPAATSAWLPGRTCPFEAAGAYRWEQNRAVGEAERFFCDAGGKELDVYRDGMLPLFHRVAETVRVHNSDWSIFAEIDPFGGMRGKPLPAPLPERSVNAGHWYDVRTLFLKTFDAGDRSGIAALRRRYEKELGVVEAMDRACAGAMPTLIGEFGIPFDLDHGTAYAAWADGDRGPEPWASHVGALSTMYDALDARMLNATLWNYTASNRNDLLIGDGWNQEDLSIYSHDQADPAAGRDSGGRGVAGFCRPCPRRVTGTIEAFGFDSEAGVFSMRYDASGPGETVIFVPAIHFPGAPLVETSGAVADWRYDADSQLLTVAQSGGGTTEIVVRRAAAGSAG